MKRPGIKTISGLLIWLRFCLELNFQREILVGIEYFGIGPGIIENQVDVIGDFKIYAAAKRESVQPFVLIRVIVTRSEGELAVINVFETALPKILGIVVGLKIPRDYSQVLISIDQVIVEANIE